MTEFRHFKVASERSDIVGGTAVNNHRQTDLMTWQPGRQHFVIFYDEKHTRNLQIREDDGVTMLT